MDIPPGTTFAYFEGKVRLYSAGPDDTQTVYAKAYIEDGLLQRIFRTWLDDHNPKLFDPEEGLPAFLRKDMMVSWAYTRMDNAMWLEFEGFVPERYYSRPELEEYVKHLQYLWRSAGYPADVWCKEGLRMERRPQSVQYVVQ